MGARPRKSIAIVVHRGVKRANILGIASSHHHCSSTLYTYIYVHTTCAAAEIVQSWLGPFVAAASSVASLCTIITFRRGGDETQMSHYVYLIKLENWFLFSLLGDEKHVSVRISWWCNRITSGKCEISALNRSKFRWVDQNGLDQ
jgi:hypothetical protein